MNFSQNLSLLLRILFVSLALHTTASWARVPDFDIDVPSTRSLDIDAPRTRGLDVDTPKIRTPEVDARIRQPGIDTPSGRSFGVADAPTNVKSRFKGAGEVIKGQFKGGAGAGKMVAAGVAAGTIGLGIKEAVEAAKDKKSQAEQFLAGLKEAGLLEKDQEAEAVETAQAPTLPAAEQETTRMRSISAEQADRMINTLEKIANALEIIAAEYQEVLGITTRMAPSIPQR